jgi:hypothetical protein
MSLRSRFIARWRQLNSLLRGPLLTIQLVDIRAASCPCASWIDTERASPSDSLRIKVGSDF